MNALVVFIYEKQYNSGSLFTYPRTCDVMACVFYESCRVKNNGDSCKNLEKTARKWLNLACNLAQTQLIFTKIEVLYLYLNTGDSSQNASYDL